MLRRYSVNFTILSVVLDGFFVGASLVAAKLFRPFFSNLPFVKDAWKADIPTPLYWIFILLWLGVFFLVSVYNPKQNQRIIDEFVRITIGSLLAGVSLAGILYLSYREISRFLYITFVVQAFIGMIGWRLFARMIFHGSQQPIAKTRNIVIIGAGPVGRQVQQQIHDSPNLGLDVIGFLDDDVTKNLSAKDILGTINSIHDVVSQNTIDDVIVALPRRAHEKVSQIIHDLQELPIKVWVIPDYFHLAIHKTAAEEFAGLPILDLKAPALNDYERVIKRFFDLVVGFIILILILPILLIIGIAIKLDSPGPALFKQRRVGENGKLFWMHKFRSMEIDADKRLNEVMTKDSDGNIIHKVKDDPRVTRVGKFIRSTSMDELPNLINVLVGEMSLVGPRPEMPLLVEKYEPWQRTRFSVPQGMTGWWQVNGRSDKPMHLNTEDDLYYVRNYSIFLDLKILYRTIWVVIRRKGAF